MNKKVMILVVILECILSILLIAVLGKAIESFYVETEATQIHFTTADGMVLEPGMLYDEKEGTINRIESERLVIEIDRPDKGYQLHWEVITKDTTDKSVTFHATSLDPNVEVSVDENGFVFFEDDIAATITISTKNGRTATVLLTPRQKETGGTIALE